jgi:hypothetical protein
LIVWFVWFASAANVIETICKKYVSQCKWLEVISFELSWSLKRIQREVFLSPMIKSNRFNILVHRVKFL